MLDLFCSKMAAKNFDFILGALCSLFISSKFVQVKYPSVDSLNSLVDFNYEFEDFTEMEAKILQVTDWQLI